MGVRRVVSNQRGDEIVVPNGVGNGGISPAS